MAAASSSVSPADQFPQLTPMLRPRQSYRQQNNGGLKTVDLKANYFKLQPLASKHHSVYPIVQYSVEIFRKKKKQRHNPSRSDDTRNTLPVEGDPEMQWVDVASKSERHSFRRNVFRAFITTHCQNTLRRVSYDGACIAFTSGIVAQEAVRPVLDCLKPLHVKMNGLLCSDTDLSLEGETVMVRMTVTTLNMSLKSLVKDDSGSTPAEEESNALNMILTSCMEYNPKYVQIAKYFFGKEEAETEHAALNDHANIWQGYFTSVRPSQNGLLINIDRAISTFWKYAGLRLQEVILSLNHNQHVSAGTPANHVDKVTRILRGIRVRARHTRRVYCFYGFSKRNASQETFSGTDNQQISVADYFFNEYPDFPLTNPNTCCVTTSSSGRVKLPVELLEVVELQKYAKNLKSDERRKMIANARKDPRSRFGDISGFKKTLYEGLCRDGLPLLTNNSTAEQVKARVLESLAIQYSCGSVKSALWSREGSQKMFLKPATLDKNWVFIYVGRAKNRDADLKAFVKAGRDRGMDIRFPARDIFLPTRSPAKDVVNEMERNLVVNNQQMKFFVIVIESEDQYGVIKKAGDINFGIPSQICLLRNWKRACFPNLILKVNTKAGGVNFMAHLKADFHLSHTSTDQHLSHKSTDQHIVLGADVTHGSPGGHRVSIAALVGIQYSKKDSADKKTPIPSYASDIYVQGENKEVFVRMGEMFKNLYRTWSEGDNRYQCPNNIIMFRDGVSESQFTEVLEKEVMDIRKAWKSLGQERELFLTYIIVTKRHHTKFVKAREPRPNRNGRIDMNIDAGCVVDTGIVSSRYYDFYLCSHAGLQGTSKPAKYTVLLDENKIGTNQLHNYVFWLTHNFGSCLRSVSLVNTVYYAHLLADRATQYLKTETIHADLEEEEEDLQRALNSRVQLPHEIRRVPFFL